MRVKSVTSVSWMREGVISRPPPSEETICDKNHLPSTFVSGSARLSASRLLGWSRAGRFLTFGDKCFGTVQVCLSTRG